MMMVSLAQYWMQFWKTSFVFLVDTCCSNHYYYHNRIVSHQALVVVIVDHDGDADFVHFYLVLGAVVVVAEEL